MEANASLIPILSLNFRFDLMSNILRGSWFCQLLLLVSVVLFVWISFWLVSTLSAEFSRGWGNSQLSSLSLIVHWFFFIDSTFCISVFLFSVTFFCCWLMAFKDFRTLEKLPRRCLTPHSEQIQWTENILWKFSFVLYIRASTRSRPLRPTSVATYWILFSFLNKTFTFRSTIIRNWLISVFWYQHVKCVTNCQISSSEE